MIGIERSAAIAGLAALSLVAGCIVNSVVPDEEDIGVPTIEVTEPEEGDTVHPQDSKRLKAEIEGNIHEPATLRLTLNDSLMTEWSPDPPEVISLYYVPGQWADPNDDLTLKLELVDGNGGVFADSVTVTLDDYYSEPPILSRPLDRHVYFHTGDENIRLEAEDYADGYSEEYEYEVAADSLFTVDVIRETDDSEILLDMPMSGVWFWRVRVGGAYDIVSPWSETRRFVVIEDAAFSPDFLSLSQIDRAIVGSDGTYLLGRDGGCAALMKCDADLARVWSAGFEGTDGASVLHCDETPSGDVFVLADHLSTSMSYPSWFFLLSGDGELLWSRELQEYDEPTHVYATSDDRLLCGFNDRYSPFLAKIDTTEVADWEIEPSYGQMCLRLLGDRDAGRYTYLSRTYSGAFRVGEVSLDSTFVWSAGLNFAASSIGTNYALERLADGDLLYGLEVLVSYEWQILLGRLDPTGAPLWQVGVAPQGDGSYTRLYLGNVREHVDGDLFVIGSWSDSTSYGTYDVVLARLAPDGELRWIRTYGSNGLNEYGQDLVLGDDRIFLLGRQGDSANEIALVMPVDFDGDLVLDAYPEGGRR